MFKHVYLLPAAAATHDHDRAGASQRHHFDRQGQPDDVGVGERPAELPLGGLDRAVRLFDAERRLPSAEPASGRISRSCITTRRCRIRSSSMAAMRSMAATRSSRLGGPASHGCVRLRSVPCRDAVRPGQPRGHGRHHYRTSPAAAADFLGSLGTCPGQTTGLTRGRQRPFLGISRQPDRGRLTRSWVAGDRQIAECRLRAMTRRISPPWPTVPPPRFPLR